MFGVQPMFTRMVLPRLGGSPSVWSVAMVFFQSMLLAGYAYAHVLTTIRQRYVPVAIHLALLLVATLALPLGIAQGWGAPPETAIAALWLLGLGSRILPPRDLASVASRATSRINTNNRPAWRACLAVHARRFIP